MADFTFDTKTIDSLIDKVSKSGITRLKLKNEEFELEIEAKERQVAAAVVPTAAAAAPVSVSPAAELPGGNVMKSPIVGTFYSTPSPDKPAFVTIGQRVKKGDVLFIVESMKMMNEIKSEYDGTVAEILVQNGDSVDFNQPIMVIE